MMIASYPRGLASPCGDQVQGGAGWTMFMARCPRGLASPYGDRAHVSSIARGKRLQLSIR